MAEKTTAAGTETASGVQPFPVYSKRSTEKANRAAHLYFAEGKSFQEAMLGAGYSKTVAKQGPKFMLGHSVGLRAAFERASKQHLRPEQLKTLAIHRLAQEIANPKRTDGVKPIEVLGKMKEFDWFVRSADVHVGVFAALLDPETGPPIDTAEAAISRYRE
jgi:autotransporter translocation and assembly factor TamB